MVTARRTPRRGSQVEPWLLSINRFSPQSVGLVAAWPRGQGLLCPDVAGFRNNLTPSNTGVFTGAQEGAGLPATEEDASRTYNVRNSAPVGVPAANGVLSIAFWNYAVSASGKQSLFGYGDPSGVSGWNFQHSSGSGVYNAANGGTIIDFTSFADAPAWHHFAYTYDGATSRLYFDGQQVASNSNAPSGGTVNMISLHQNIHPSFPENNGGNSKIADARLYSVAVAPGVIWSMFDRATRHELYCWPGVNRRGLVDVNLVAEALPPGVQLISLP